MEIRPETKKLLQLTIRAMKCWISLVEKWLSGEDA